MLDTREKVDNNTETKYNSDVQIPEVDNSHFLIKDMERELLYVKAQYELVRKERDYYKRKLLYIEQSRTWKITYPFRRLLDVMKKLFTFRDDQIRNSNHSNKKENLILPIGVEELATYPTIAKEFPGSNFFQVKLLSPSNNKMRNIKLLICLNPVTVVEYLKELKESEIFKEADDCWGNIEKTIEELNTTVPVLIYSARLNNYENFEEMKSAVLFELDLINHNLENVTVKFSRSFKEFYKALHREPQAPYKLLHQLLAFQLISNNLEAAKSNLRIALQYPGFSLYTRIQTSFFSEALNDILEAVKGKVTNYPVDEIDLIELTAAILYASGYRQIALKILNPVEESAKRIDVRTLAFGLAAPPRSLRHFMQSSNGKQSFESLGSRDLGKAELLFLTLRAKPNDFMNLFQFLCEKYGDKPLLEGNDKETDKLVIEIVNKVNTFQRTGVYHAPNEYGHDYEVHQLESLDNPVKKLFISGFGWSGSSALSDIIKDCPGVTVMPGPGKHKLINLGAEDETTIFEQTGSLEALWDKYISDEKKPTALSDFIRIHVLGVLPKRALEMKACFWTRSFVKKYGKVYYKLVDEFLYELFGKAKTIKEKKESFVRFSTRLINLVAIKDEAEVIIFDNAIKAQNIKRLEMIGEATCIVVSRDPDDQYISMQNENIYVKRNPETFVSMQYEKINAFTNGANYLQEQELEIRPYAIFFEDLVLNGEKWREDLLKELLGPDVKVPNENAPNARFKSSESAKNIGQYKSVGRISSEHGLTRDVYEKILGPYLWKGKNG